MNLNRLIFSLQKKIGFFMTIYKKKKNEKNKYMDEYMNK